MGGKNSHHSVSPAAVVSMSEADEFIDGLPPEGSPGLVAGRTSAGRVVDSVHGAGQPPVEEF